MLHAIHAHMFTKLHTYSSELEPDYTSYLLSLRLIHDFMLDCEYIALCSVNYLESYTSLSDDDHSGSAGSVPGLALKSGFRLSGSNKFREIKFYQTWTMDGARCRVYKVMRVPDVSLADLLVFRPHHQHRKLVECETRIKSSSQPIARPR